MTKKIKDLVSILKNLAKIGTVEAISDTERISLVLEIALNNCRIH